MSDIKNEPTKTLLTYDDVLIKPSYSEVLPSETDLKTRFSKNITLNIPIVSAAMDTVTEAPVAIIMAQQGGIGVIHKNLSPKMQAKEVQKVKRYRTGMIVDPITISEDENLQAIFNLTKKFEFTGLPVVDKNNKIAGIITNRDILFETNPNKLIKDIMTPRDSLITAPIGTSMEDAKKLLHKHRIEKLPLVNKEDELVGLITVKDIRKDIENPNANIDALGRLCVAAAIGVGDNEFERAETLVKANVDAIVVDTAHGHSKKVIEMVKKLKANFDSIDVVAGNIATKEACKDLIKAGVDAIKVGIGPGSICTTRIIAGIGVPQLSAVMDCYEICKKTATPFIADGGIKYSGDIVKALAAGASSVMVGSLFAATSEAPGETVIYQGRSYKTYRGMGSLSAMALGAKDRYSQGDVKDNQKLVPEGIEGQVPHRGPLTSNIFQLIGGVRSGMGYIGAANLKELKEKANFIKITESSLKEGHPHNVLITKEAPNYRPS